MLRRGGAFAARPCKDPRHRFDRGGVRAGCYVNAIVADVYGPQTLLARGLLPPALVFGHPGYLRAVRGFTPPGGQYLQIVAADLVCAPDGTWTVMSHRAEAPSGLGYALENRLIVSSLFADPFRELHVARLAPTYSQLIGTLAAAARTTASSLKAIRSSRLPPPRATISRSGLGTVPSAAMALKPSIAATI